MSNKSKKKQLGMDVSMDVSMDMDTDSKLFAKSLESPMMQQYIAIKDKHPDAILFFRMGDFYEMFLEDAIVASKILDIQLTKRQKCIPMAGLPYHSYHSYVRKLLAAGQRVAIAEQEVDPRNAKLMIRRVRRILSSGTIVEDELSDHSQHNYLMSLALESSGRFAVATADFATADFFVYPFEKSNVDQPQMTDIVSRFFASLAPKEILISEKDEKKFTAYSRFGQKSSYPFIVLADWLSKNTEGVRIIENMYQVKPNFLSLPENHPAFSAMSMILHYLQQHYPSHPELLSKPIRRYYFSEHMHLDQETITQLDLLNNQQEGSRSQQRQPRCLLSVLDECLTQCGRRLLREKIVHPYREPALIKKSLDRLEFLLHHRDVHKKIRESLKHVTDLEHIINRLAIDNGRPRDFSSIKNTLQAIQRLTSSAQGDAQTSAMEPTTIDVQLPTSLQELLAKISQTIVEHPGTQLDPDTPFVKLGVSAELDKARHAKNHSGSLIAEFEATERRKMGIERLVVRHNKIIGYYIELNRTLAEKAKLPADYYLQQTLQNQQRYTTPRLHEIQAKIKIASEVIVHKEKEIFQMLAKKVSLLRAEIRALMKQIAELDTIQGLAQTAGQLDWCRPQFFTDHAEHTGAPHVPDNSECGLRIETGRHPVIEYYLPADRQFIANDFFLKKEERLVILSGPNMAGKSTFIRQIAIIQLLAQMGSYVPAAQAHLPLVDQIFTRIGAHDNLTQGESTFFVEMQESARILAHATQASLIVMDEIGRGTSTQDGYALAASILEYIVHSIGAITLFSTHFHELTRAMPILLQQKKQNDNANRNTVVSPVVNMTLEVLEDKQKGIIFTHKAIRGTSNQSHGLHVAQLAGLPDAVIRNAKQRLEKPNLFE